MLIELAIGDAYGACFEYVDKEFVREFNNLSKFVQNPKFQDLKPGKYTDDTQMSIAITEVILYGKDWTQEILAESFVNCFKRDHRKGYSKNFYQILNEVNNGIELIIKVNPNSDKSGAAMRSCPIGIYKNIDEVIEKATIQARITHNTTEGINSAIVSALMLHYFLYDLGNKNDLPEFISSYLPRNYFNNIYEWKVEVGPKGLMSVNAALTAITKNEKMSELLKSCIAYSGDVDTVAAIALASASCSKEYEQDIPRNLYENLEDGDFGRDYLIELDRRFMSLRDYNEI